MSAPPRRPPVAPPPLPRCPHCGGNVLASYVHTALYQAWEWRCLACDREVGAREAMPMP